MIFIEREKNQHETVNAIFELSIQNSTLKLEHLSIYIFLPQG